MSSFSLLQVPIEIGDTNVQIVFQCQPPLGNQCQVEGYLIITVVTRTLLTKHSVQDSQRTRGERQDSLEGNTEPEDIVINMSILI